MTRRAQRRRRVLSVNAYIHRATLGLPKDERLDAAAELRAHLLERIAEHEAQGFSREEAEYLAVKGMGEPSVTNRELLGHFLTNRAGWLTLAALLTGIAAWGAYRATHWVGVRPAQSISLDDTAMMAIPQANWPDLYPNFRKVSEVRFPAGTRRVLAGYLSHSSATVRPSFSFPVTTTVSYSAPGKGSIEPMPDDYPVKFWRGRFRLISLAAPTPPLSSMPRRCPKGQFQVANVLYGINLYRPRQEGVAWRSTHGVDSVNDLGSGFCFDNDSQVVDMVATELPLNTWTAVMTIPSGPPRQEAALALLLYPTDRQTLDPQNNRPEDAYAYNPAARQWQRR